MYRIQTQRKLYGAMGEVYKQDCGLDDLYAELFKKHSKRTYAGKPTRRALRIIEKIQKIERLSDIDVMRILNN